MTKAHRDAVLELAPRQLNRTFTLGEAAMLAMDATVVTIDDLAARRAYLAAKEVPEIADPIGESPEFHARVGAQIAELLRPVVQLCRRSSVGSS